MKTTIKRRSFLSAAFAALCAPALPAPAAPVKSFCVVLEANEGGEVYTGEGDSVAAAMASLRQNIEGCTCEFDEYFAEVFAESTAELIGGASRASHWDFSCPESAYTITLSEVVRLKGGRVA